MINPIIIRAMANSYTDESIEGGGAVKGKNCTIQSIVHNDDKSVVTFAWTLDGGTVTTDTMTVKDGESAYKIAVRLGYTGTEAEWLESLKGDSAYDIAVQEGYVGTRAEWIASLKGEKGDTGAGIAKAEFDADGKLVFTRDDEEGTQLPPVEMPPTKVDISKDPGNVAENRSDGFYVPKGAVEISKDEGNAIESKADGLFAQKTNISTAFGDTTSDDKVPSEKLVKTELDKKANTDDVYDISTDADNALTEGTDGGLFVPKSDAQVQADWTQTDNTKPDFIKNKLEVVSAFNVVTSDDKVASEKLVKTELDKKINTEDISTAFGDTTSDDKVASEKLVKTELDKKINTEDISTAFGDTTSDDKVASEKLVKTELDKKINTEDISTAFGDTTSDDKVASEKLVKTELDKKIDSEKIVTEFGETPSDDNIPSEKLVYDSIEHFDERIDQLQLFKFPNAVIHGEPSINNGQISEFSAINYLAFPFLVDFHNRTFTIDMAFTTGSDVTTQQNIIDGKFGLALAVANGHFLLAVSTDGTTWDVGVMPGVYAVLPNTNYYLKLIFDGTQYKLSYSLDGETYVDDISHTSSASPYPVQVYIGVGDLDVPGGEKPFLGIINMNKSLLTINDQVVWQGMDDAGLSTRLATDLDNIDELGIRKIQQIAETDKKVDKVDGKGLSTNDYTDEDKAEVEKVKDKADKLESVELKMLGWNVPKDCPIQNEISGNLFIQKVGRFELSLLYWGGEAPKFNGGGDVLANAKLGSYDTPSKMYTHSYNTIAKWEADGGVNGIAMSDWNRSVYLTDDTKSNVEELKSSLRGKFLYFELETPISIPIDGNELSIGIKYYNGASTQNLDCNNLTDPICLVSPTFMDDWAERHFPFNGLMYIRTNRNIDDGIQVATSYYGDRRVYRTMTNNVWQPWQECTTKKYLADVLMSKNSSVTDLNEHVGQEGKQHYYVYANSLCANVPIHNGDDFQVEIISKYDNSCIQVAYTLDNGGRDTVGNIYTRSAQMDRDTKVWTWSNWTELATINKVGDVMKYMDITLGQININISENGWYYSDRIYVDLPAGYEIVNAVFVGGFWSGITIACVVDNQIILQCHNQYTIAEGLYHMRVLISKKN